MARPYDSKKGDRLYPGAVIAEVPETRAITHKVMVPPDMEGFVLSVAEDGGLHHRGAFGDHPEKKTAQRPFFP